MRIRKRKVPLPLSLLSPIPLTDPHLFSRSPVMVVQTEAPTASSNNTVNHTSSSIIHDSQPSDHLTKSWSSDLRRLIVANTAPTHHDVTEVKGVLTNNDDASNLKLATTKNTNGAAPHHLSPSTNEEEGRWCEGDKAIPLKKRRGMSFSNINVDPSTQEEQEIKSSQNNNNDNNNNNNNKNNNNNGISGKKGNSKRGNTIMEGSRCSRVNGRGWRCCQPTLVGYSLCEHHLGKGRLRSITTNTGVKAKSSITKKKRSSNSNNEDQKVEHEHEHDHNDKKNERTTMKLGVVKARSLSSLLSQTNTINIAGDNNDHASPHQHHQTTVTNLDHS